MAVAAAVFMGALVSAGQAVPAPKNEDVLPALLAEVRGLRAAMEQLASAGPRVQLFASRLQLQETRMNNAIRRLEDVRDSLTTARDQMEAAQETVTRVEAQLAAGAPLPGRDELTQVLAHTKRELVEGKALVARLSAEESQLTQDLGVEQARWTEINQRLDELERALIKR